MKGCPEYEELLLLDIHQELDTSSRARWMTHLASCPACKKEALRMGQVVGKVKEHLTPPPLASNAKEGLVRAVRKSVNAEGRGAWPSWSLAWGWFSRPWRFSTALATVCVFAALISLFTLGNFQELLYRNGSSGQETPQGLVSEEAEIIQNLDLLKQLDSLQILVQTLDEPDGDPTPPEPTSNTRGAEKS